MHIKRLLVITAILGLTAFSGNAQVERWEYQRGGELFRTQEFDLDLFGTWATRDRRHFSGGHAGAGVGFAYFFDRHIGVGADTYLERFSTPTHVDVSLIGRLPLEDLRLAPYGFVGAGRQFRHVGQWTAHGGAGLEFRMNQMTGLFVDGRRVFTDRTRDFTLWRAGVRIGF
jgi:hypothetical protein